MNKEPATVEHYVMRRGNQTDNGRRFMLVFDRNAVEYRGRCARAGACQVVDLLRVGIAREQLYAVR